MQNLHLAIVLSGVILAGALVFLYYWGQNRADGSLIGTLLLGVILGLVTVGALLQSYWLFSFILAGYAAYFIYLRDHSAFNATTESTMASLFAGGVIGLSGLVGCILCT